MCVLDPVFFEVKQNTIDYSHIVNRIKPEYYRYYHITLLSVASNFLAHINKCITTFIYYNHIPYLILTSDGQYDTKSIDTTDTILSKVGIDTTNPVS